MTLEERREQLVEELGRLIEAVVSPDTFPLRGPDSSAPEGSLLAEQERLLKEMTAELDAINARMQSPAYRFHAFCFPARGWIWVLAVVYSLISLVFAALLGGGYAAFYLISAALTIVWAVWSSIPTKA